MKYRVFFINKAFQELVDKSMLEQLLQEKEDSFLSKQIEYFLHHINLERILSDALSYFRYRDDIIYRDDEIILSNRITKEVGTLSINGDEVIVDVLTLDNPLITFLYVHYRPIIIIEYEKTIRVSN